MLKPVPIAQEISVDEQEDVVDIADRLQSLGSMREVEICWYLRRDATIGCVLRTCEGATVCSAGGDSEAAS